MSAEWLSKALFSSQIWMQRHKNDTGAANLSHPQNPTTVTKARGAGQTSKGLFWFSLLLTH